MTLAHVRRTDGGSLSPLPHQGRQGRDTPCDDRHDRQVRHLVTLLLSAYLAVALIGAVVAAASKLRWMELAFAAMAVADTVALCRLAHGRRPAMPAAAADGSPSSPPAHAGLARHA
ncbi:MAG: hypothetical protein ACYC3Q_00770 [Gemmatimonadaceae bacterium]